MYKKGVDLISFLTRVVDDGIQAASESYKDDPKKLKGSIAGFEACRWKTPAEIASLLEGARRETQEAYFKQAEDYWEVRCRELEIEWVANVLSAALQNSGLATIVTPTYRGTMKAADILGVG